MLRYEDPELHTVNALRRAYVATKAGGVVAPPVIDVHPVSGQCNLDCRWCIGRATRNIIEPLPSVMTPETLIHLLSKILDPKWRHLWPSEFHFCGSDSEPLIASDAVVPAIRFLLQRKRSVELVTNGLLLSDPRLIDIIPRINKLHVSLDVTNDEDYKNFKLPNDKRDLKGYSIVLENLTKIEERRKQLSSNLDVKVSFVFIRETFSESKWITCVSNLQKAGVKKIRVRNDLSGKFAAIPNLKEIVHTSYHKCNKKIDIRFAAPDTAFSECDFQYCRSPLLWPTLAADGALYPCAHTANSKFEPFGNLLAADSLIELYQKLFGTASNDHLLVETIACQRPCPPLIGSLNDNKTAENVLGKSCYV